MPMPRPQDGPRAPDRSGPGSPTSRAASAPPLRPPVPPPNPACAASSVTVALSVAAHKSVSQKLDLRSEEADWELAKQTPSADRTTTLAASSPEKALGSSVEFPSIVDWLERIERIGQENNRQITEMQELLRDFAKDGKCAGPVTSHVAHVSSNGSYGNRSDDDRELWIATSDAHDAGGLHVRNALSSKLNQHQKDRIWNSAASLKRDDEHRLTKPLSSRQEKNMKDTATDLQKIVDSRMYEAVSLSLVLSNVFLMGWELHEEALTGSQFSTSQVLEYFFTTAFTLELIPRVIAHKRDFFYSAWDVFDFVIVAMMLSEQVLSAAFSGGSFALLGAMSSLRVLRVIRIVRALRVIRVLRFFRELRLLFMSILMSLKLLLWSFIVISLILYVFAVSFTNGFIEHCYTGDPLPECNDDGALRVKFGGIDVSMLSLFKVMTGGINWGELLDLLIPVGALYSTILLCFVWFALLTVLNVITAIFVDAVTHVMSFDREAVIQEQMADETQLMKDIREIFYAMDIDHSGNIGLEEFHEAMRDERMVAYCNAMELNIFEADTLFVMLDQHHDGNISIEEFIQGFIHLKGDAKNVDVQKVLVLCDVILGRLQRLQGALLPPGMTPAQTERVQQAGLQ